METTLEEVAKHKVKLRVDVPPEEVQPVMDLAYRHLADQVKVPGFRKGKTPRKLIDARAGRDAVLQEFLEHALPNFYAKALREHELAPIADPEFDDLDASDVETAGLRFTATVEIRPRLTFEEADYQGLQVERPTARVSEAEVDEQLDRLRERFAELETAGHPARRGDYAVADIHATVHGQEVPEASGQGILYEIGSGSFVPELDQELEGKRKGDIVKFNATLPERFADEAGKELTFQVLVKEVKSKQLPALDDEFAKTASEFDTLDELKSDIRAKLGELKEALVDGEVRDRALQALIERVDVELPERLVDEETERRVRATRDRAEERGTTLENVLQASGMDELQFRADARAHAVRAIKADLALEGVARAANIRATDEELDEVVTSLAREAERDAKDVRRILESTGQIVSVAGDIIRKKALDLVVEHADVAGEEGSPPEPQEPDQPAERPTEGKEG